MQPARSRIAAANASASGNAFRQVPASVNFTERFRLKHAATDAAAQPRVGRAAATFAARLTFEAVERRYLATAALAGFSLDIAPAEVVCLLGPSGCGKTTLLRIACRHRAADRRPRADQRLGGGGPGALRAAGEAQRRPDVPGLRAVPAPDASSTTSPSASSRCRGRMRAARRWRRWPASASSATPTTIRTSSPAASSSAWRWRAPSCRGPP